jgi:hypothetical protein
LLLGVERPTRRLDLFKGLVERQAIALEPPVEDRGFLSL